MLEFMEDGHHKFIVKFITHFLCGMAQLSYWVCTLRKLREIPAPPPEKAN